MRLLAFLVAASLAAGCNHCDPSYCEGANLHTCGLEGNDAGRTAIWRSTPCRGACVPDESGGDAFCAESATPIPECQQAGDICLHGAAATCRSGYLEASKACSGACVLAKGTAFCAESSGPVAECKQDGLACYQGAVGTCRAGYLESSKACTGGSTCAAAGACGPICVLGAAPDSSCPSPIDAAGQSSYCNGGTQVGCQCGYAVASVGCDAFCVAMGGDTRCTLSSTRDPRCGSPPQPSSAFCDANTAWSCWNGYPIDTQPCGTNGTCVIEADGAGACSFSGR